MKMLLAVLTPVEESIQEHPNALDREKEKSDFLLEKKRAQKHTLSKPNKGEKHTAIL
jgi:hypothetical protein